MGGPHPGDEAPDLSQYGITPARCGTSRLTRNCCRIFSQRYSVAVSEHKYAPVPAPTGHRPGPPRVQAATHRTHVLGTHGRPSLKSWAAPATPGYPVGQ